MAEINGIINYLSECYQADNHETGLLNFFSAKVEKTKILPEAGELLSGEMPFLPIGNNKYSLETQKILQLYKKEKELFLGALFIIGKSSNPNISSLCAPLLMYPAYITEKEYIDEAMGYTFTYDADKVSINIPLLREVFKDNENGMIDEFISKIQGGAITFAYISKIKTLLEQYTLLHTENLLMFPKLYTSRKLKSMQKTNTEGSGEFMILPVCGVGVITKSTESRGLINELEKLKEEKNFSAPIQAIYGNKVVAAKKESKGLVPAILSLAQTQTLESASQFPFSVIVGPPGTGKTFTISSLAIEQISKGKSVLIVSRTDEAVDVVEKKINDVLKIDNITIRGGKRDHLRFLKKYIDNLLKGLYTNDLKYNSPLKIQKKRIAKSEKAIANKEKNLQRRIAKNIKRSNYLYNKQTEQSLWVKTKLQYLNYRQSKKAMLHALMHAYEKQLEDYQWRVSNYLSDHYKAQISDVLYKKRADLQLFLKSIRARTGSRQEELQGQFSFQTLLKTFPIWLTKISDISRVLPMENELFDMVIVDEATQCDMASLIPVFQRAKKVVLAGDPNQLKHVSFLSKGRQNLLSEKINGDNKYSNEFNYRNDSVLDYSITKTENQKQISFLNEHFRSVSSIIAFSNKHFYEDKLMVMTQKPSNLSNEGVELIKLDGNRNKNGINSIELNHLVEKLRSKVNEQKELSQSLCDTIGVLSPFRAQVDALSKKIMQEFSINEIERHELMVGTAYSFQGQERDIMLLSLSLDNGSHHSAFIHCNKADVFNVSITRAKKQQIVFHSLDVAKVETKYLLREFLELYSNSDKEQFESFNREETKDKFLQEMNIELLAKGWQTWPGFFIAGQVVDILVKTNNSYFGIDLIGYPGEYEQAFTLERYKMLKRASLNVFPVSYIDWITRKEECLKALVDMNKD